MIPPAMHLYVWFNESIPILLQTLTGFSSFLGYKIHVEKKWNAGRHNKHDGSLSDFVGAPSQTKSMKIHETKSMKIAQNVNVCSKM